MGLDAILEQLQRTARAPGTGIALAANCYLDEEFYQLELERVLRPEWHAVARKDEPPEVLLGEDERSSTLAW